MKKLLRFVLTSSADPKQVSASVKFALLALIPYAMQALDLVCSFGNQCYSVDASVLEIGIKAVADGTFYALSFVAAIGTLWGVLRKVYRTFTGQNLAMKES